MKKLHHIALCFLLVVTLTGCVGIPPVDVQLEMNPHQTELSDSADKIRIYFPSFLNEAWSAKNDGVIGGDGTVIILPDNQVMVIDGFYSTARKEYEAFIRSLGITHIDYLVLTHFHGDHSGSLPYLIEKFGIDTVYTNGGYVDTSAAKAMLDAIDKFNVKEIIIKEGDNFTLGDCAITVFAPNLTEEDLYNLYYNRGKTAKKVNNSSLVFKLEYGDFSILFTGDIYKGADRKLCRKYGDELNCTILKVPHHGEFYTANSGDFARTVQPEYGIVMDNRYVSTMGSIIQNKYHAYGGTILYRNDAGYILVESDGKDYSIEEASF